MTLCFASCCVLNPAGSFGGFAVVLVQAINCKVKILEGVTLLSVSLLLLLLLLKFKSEHL